MPVHGRAHESSRSTVRGSRSPAKNVSSTCWNIGSEPAARAKWQPGLTPPWRQSDPRLEWLWLARHGAALWLPTSAERDDAWWAQHGEAVERSRNHRGQLEGFRHLTG
jgi:hypothetical protein